MRQYRLGGIEPLFSRENHADDIARSHKAYSQRDLREMLDAIRRAFYPLLRQADA
jgi:hypothetical protein